MFLRYKYRIYPNKNQQVLLEKHFGACRFIYNLALETKISAYQSGVKLSCFDLGKQLTQLKNDLPWLKEINAQSLEQELSNLDDAYTNFFKGRSNFPKFKSKQNLKSFYSRQRNKIDGNKLILPKFQEGINIILTKQIDSKIKGITIIKTPTDKYFASILYDIDKSLPEKNIVAKDNSIGIDLGLKDFSVESNGTKTPNPKYLDQSLQRLKVLQRRLSKKKKGSKNYHKQRIQIAKLHETITNQRRDFIHKLSTKIVSENQGAIIVEDLNVKGMMQNRSLSKSIGQTGWGSFVSMLEYKSNWNGRTFHKIGRFEPSSKMCTCGTINKELQLSDRVWTCKSCKTTHDRDLLAANNIKTFGLIRLTAGEVIPGELAEKFSLENSMKQEVSI